MIEILHRYTKAVLYRSETATTVKDAVFEAVKAKSNLSGSNLRGSDLRGLDLRGLDLRGSNLRESNLSGSDLSGSDLSGSDLSGSDLSGSDLRWSNLRGSNLRGSDLRGSDLRGLDLSGLDLRGSDLRWSNLSGSDLSGSDLSGSNLRGSEELPHIAAAQTTITPQGDLIGWKKCYGKVIVKLLIPASAKRSNATGRKCRAEYADVLEVIGSLEGVSNHDGKTRYIAGQRVTCDSWCEDRWQECAGGIHFFITREEAEEY
jgi:hypothetical protein